jgi:hypothetical protein
MLSKRHHGMCCFGLVGEAINFDFGSQSTEATNLSLSHKNRSRGLKNQQRLTLTMAADATAAA